MPTGYTAPIEERDDFTFEEYVWRCATVFDAFVNQRDSGLDSPRPAEQVPDRYHEYALNSARYELELLQKMSVETANAIVEREYREARMQHDAAMERMTKVWKRYRDMRARAEAWKPPTPEHASLREFMISQIDLSTQYINPDDDHYAPEELTGIQWLAHKIEIKKELVAHHEEGWKKEQKRVRRANAWIKALADAVPPPKGALR